MIARFHRFSAMVSAAGLSLTMAVSGCAVLNAQLVDYASLDSGATVTVSGTDGSYAASNLIDGITKAGAWAPDAGWQYTFERSGGYSGGSIEDNMSLGSAWVHIEFPATRRVNRIAVYGLNTVENPYPGILNGLVQVHTPDDPTFPWKTVGQVEKGRVIVLGKQATMARPTTVFRFNQMNADAVRVVIYTMGDSRSVRADRADERQGQGGRRFGGRTTSSRSQETTVRLVEIEVTGSEAAKPALETAVE